MTKVKWWERSYRACLENTGQKQNKGTSVSGQEGVIGTLFTFWPENNKKNRTTKRNQKTAGKIYRNWTSGNKQQWSQEIRNKLGENYSPPVHNTEFTSSDAWKNLGRGRGDRAEPLRTLKQPTLAGLELREQRAVERENPQIFSGMRRSTCVCATWDPGKEPPEGMRETSTQGSHRAGNDACSCCPNWKNTGSVGRSSQRTLASAVSSH